MQMFDLVAVHQIGPTAGLNLRLVWIGVVWKPQVESSAPSLAVEPVFALRIVEVMRFVFEVVSHVAHDDPAGAAAGPPAKPQAMPFQVHYFDLGGIGRTHDPAELRPDQCPLEIVRGLVSDIPGVNAQVNSLAARVRGGVPEWLARVIPDPPLTLHVVWVGHLPVGCPRQRDADNRAVVLDAPNAARREVEVRPPNFPWFGDVGMIGAPGPRGDALGTAEHRLAGSPSRVTGEPDGFPGSAGIPDQQPPAINHAAFEDVGVHARQRGGPARGQRIPRVALPGSVRGVTRVRVVAGFEINVPDRVTRLECERPRFPGQVAPGIHLGVGLLPGPARRL